MTARVISAGHGAPASARECDAMQGYLRFPLCGECGSRSRVVVDTDLGLRGRCLGCGADLGCAMEGAGLGG